MTWQPVETAPKDGTDLWLFSPHDDPQQFVGRWIEDEGRVMWQYADDPWALGPEPTHWMPLLEPPNG